jgi:hypothetical protein
MTDTTERPAAPAPWPEAWRPLPPPEPEPEAITLTCPCSRVGRTCAGCILPPLGVRPPITHPVGRVAASVGGPYWRMRGWLYGLTHDE